MKTDLNYRNYGISKIVDLTDPKEKKTLWRIVFFIVYIFFTISMSL